MRNFIAGIFLGIILVGIFINQILPKEPLGNCTVINPDGSETIYKNCLINIVVTKEQGFLTYKKFTFVRGL